MDLSILKEKSWSEVIEKVKASPISAIFQREFTTSGERDLRIHLFTTLIKVAWIDRDLSKLEYKYILKKVSRLLKEDDESLLKEQFNLVSTMVRKNVKSREYIPWHVLFLAKEIDSNADKFMDILVGLIGADGKMEKKEEDFLDEFSALIGIDGRKLQEYKVNARFTLTQFQKEEKISEDEAKENHVLPEIKLELDF